MFRQKFYAIILLVLSGITMAMGDGTVALLLIPLGLYLLCSKRNWLYY